MKNKLLFVILTMIFTEQAMFSSVQQQAIGFKSLSIDTNSPELVAPSPKSILKIGGSTSPLDTHGSVTPKRVFFDYSLRSPSHFTTKVIEVLENDDFDIAKQCVDAMCKGGLITTQMQKETLDELTFVAFNTMIKGAGNEEEMSETMDHIHGAFAIAKTASTDLASDSRDW